MSSRNFLRLQKSKIYSICSTKKGSWTLGEYIDSQSFIVISCSNNHVWETKARNILEGKWCPVCGKISSSKIKSTKAHVKRIKSQIHYIVSGQSYRDKINKQIKQIKSNIVSSKKKKDYYLSEESKEKNKLRKKYSYDNDLNYRLNQRLKSQINKCISKDRSMGKYYELLGYSAEDLKHHLQHLFKDGMSWNNMGQWHIDHRTPKSWFNLTNEDGTINEAEVRRCWDLSNLQPLWASDNISKGNRYHS